MHTLTASYKLEAMAEQTTLEWLLLPRGTNMFLQTCVSITNIFLGMGFSVFETGDGAYYPKMTHLAWSIPIALLLSLFRKYVIEGYLLFKSFLIFLDKSRAESVNIMD